VYHIACRVMMAHAPLFGQRFWSRRFDNSEGYEDGRLDKDAGLDSIASGL
jgi:hypothetical protein